ncbi:MAG: tetratricopeptide repeat protein [Anaerolineales bacterium]|nr:tetratricopeptide repeat protein [Anaerolineales bacterium]
MGRQDLFEESMRLGHSAAWDLKWDRAIEFYRKALTQSPEDPGALTSLGLALLEMGQFKEALAIYHKAAKISPQDPIPFERCAEIFERLGQISDAVTQRNAAAERYLQRKDAQKAIENWVHIARLAPNDLNTRRTLALTYERTGRSREAVYEYLAAASIFQSSGNIELALNAIQRALKLAPGDPEGTKALKRLQSGKSLPPPTQPRGATAPLRMAKVQEYIRSEAADQLVDEDEVADPEITAQREALTLLAGLLFDEPRDEDEEADTGEDETSGLAALTRGRGVRGRKSVGQPQMYRYLGQAIDLQTRGKDREAIKEYERALKVGLDHPAVHYNIGLIYKKLKDHESAYRHLSNALGHPGLELGANLALGRIARMQDDLPEAARYLLQALRLADSLSVDKTQSTSLNQFYDTILASQEEGNEQELAQIVENTLNFLSGPDWMRRLRQARMQLESEVPESTTVVPIAEMLAVGGTDRVLQTMGRIEDLLARELYSAAMEEAMLTLDHAPSYLGLHMRIAEIMIRSDSREAGLDKMTLIAETHRARGEFPQAAEVYSKIIHEAPVNIPARTRLIELLIQQERNMDALKNYLELADIYRGMAEIDSARKVLANALPLAQDNSIEREWSLKILHEMGDIDLSRLDWRRALRVYTQVRTIDPSDEKARTNVIDLNLRLGQEDQAAQELDSYLELLVQNKRGPEALTLLEDMAREHPGKRILHQRLAEAYRAAGRKADAIAQYDALGEILLDAGHMEEAVKTIQVIIDLGPPDIEGYRELLRNLKGEE